MKIKRFNESESTNFQNSSGEIKLYRLTNPVIDLSNPGNYYVKSKSSINPDFLSKKTGDDLYVVTVKTDKSNINELKTEIECSKLGDNNVIVIEDDSKCEVISVNAYKK